MKSKLRLSIGARVILAQCWNLVNIFFCYSHQISQPPFPFFYWIVITSIDSKSPLERVNTCIHFMHFFIELLIIEFIRILVNCFFVIEVMLLVCDFYVLLKLLIYLWPGCYIICFLFRIQSLVDIDVFCHLGKLTEATLCFCVHSIHGFILLFNRCLNWFTFNNLVLLIFKARISLSQQLRRHQKNPILLKVVVIFTYGFT